MIEFNDSIQNNMEVVRELLAGATADFRKRAQRAAVQIENTIMRIHAGAPADPAVSLGVTFALLKIMALLMEAEKQHAQAGKGLIQLLS
jgi:hypothetical protein